MGVLKITDLKTPEHGIDTGMVSHVCFCGCFVFNLRVSFDDYEIGMYFLDMTCAECGASHRAPTPLDKPE